MISSLYVDKANLTLIYLSLNYFLIIMQRMLSPARHLWSKVKCSTSAFHTSVFNHNTVGHSILTPDVPSDTPETNYLLRLPRNNETIDFTQIKPNLLFRAFLKSLIELDAAYEHISNDNFKEFDEIANFLEKYISQLDYEWALLYLMTNLQPSSYALRKNGLTRCMAHLEETREKRFKNRPLYDLLSSLDRELSSSNAAKRNWIDMYLRKAQLNGLHLKGGHRTKAASLIESIRQRENKFRDNVNTSAGAFRRNVLDPEMAKQLPHNLRAATKDGRSIEVTLEPTLFQFFLAHSANERERWNVWHANNVVASMRTDLKRSNNVLIDEIRFDKRQLAQLLDFDNHVEVALQDKMATSIQTVTRFVQQLHQSTRETFNNDLQSLLRFASDCKEFTSNYMNLWDIPYFVNLTKQYEFRVEQVSSYFPLPTVLSGIFRLLANRFGIQVICDESGNRSAWSPHVQLYRLVHGDQVLGSFFLDPYANVKQVQFHQITGRCASTESKPISALLLNFQAPISGQKTLLDFEDVILLFRTVGHLLQQQSPQQAYLELNTSNAYERDASLLNSEFFSLFPIHCYDTLADCSEHVANGDKLPIEVYEQLKEFYHKFESIELTHELYKTNLDLALHLQNEHWKDVTSEVWKQYMQPFTLDKHNQHVCSAIDIMCGAQSGAYYAAQWNKVLAADLFESYLESNDRKRTLLDYTDRFLLNAGSRPLRKVFAEFRGRDPLLNPFLRLSRLGALQKPFGLLD